MKNRRIEHSFNEARIYKDYYRPSLNPIRLLRSVLGVLISGNSIAAHNYIPGKKRGF